MLAWLHGQIPARDLADHPLTPQDRAAKQRAGRGLRGGGCRSATGGGDRSRHQGLHFVVIAYRVIQGRLAAGAVEELTEATKQIRPAQSEEARDQLGEDRTKGGRNAEDKDQPYG